MIDAGLRAELRKLIAAFVENMGAMTAEMEAALDAGRRGEGDAAAAWDLLRTQTHRISGSGASFGFTDIAAVARRIDLHAAGTLSGGDAAAVAAPPWEDALVTGDLDALRRLVDRAAPTDSPLYPGD
ncbi:Hpt domain-containing protein [Albimonas pacifica]|uniref:Hpt domain-containing protein n=1 Tax=Albimonas pacifica TaxID=1114924 RepID=A0A1I3JNG0_9RHOB|nr:Hpt domain-containing protein [Albimonas pacifica]SFI61435.1 Hpt domain-containing protein [Albimonas pacifica]